LVPFGAIWCHLVPFGAIWCHLVPFGAHVCSIIPLVPFNTRIAALFSWTHLFQISLTTVQYKLIPITANVHTRTF
jgi:hypothetical protein